MPDWLKFPIVLVVITVISAVSLAYMFNLTEPARVAEAKAAQQAALKVVLPGATKFEEKNGKIKEMGFTYFEGTDEKNRLYGYAAQGGAQGYSSIVKVMAGVDKDYKIIAIKVLFQKETPGLGDKVNEILSKKTIVGLIKGTKYENEDNLRPWFQVQFDGKSIPLKVIKNGGDIDAITGATISSRAVCKAVNKAVSDLEKNLQK